METSPCGQHEALTSRLNSFDYTCQCKRGGKAVHKRDTKNRRDLLSLGQELDVVSNLHRTRLRKVLVRVSREAWRWQVGFSEACTTTETECMKKEHAHTCAHEHVEDIVDVHLAQPSIQRGAGQVGVAAAVKRERNDRLPWTPLNKINGEELTS